jgi:hypothetical protein
MRQVINFRRNVMIRPLISVLIAVTSVAAVAIAADAPKRNKKACGDYLEMVKKTSAKFGMKPDIVPGSWGKVPVELQKLPPGAQLCGAVMDQATIVSPAYGKDLETFYAPLFAKIGCQPLTCTVDDGAPQTKCKCKSATKKHGMVITDTGYEAFTLSLM